MKTKISHLGRSTVSVILAVMMLLSTMLIGTVSTVNAVGANNYKVAAGETLYLDLSNTGATEADFLEGDCVEGDVHFSSPLPDNKIVSVNLKNNIDFSTYDRRLYSYKKANNDWKHKNNVKTNLPSNGDNMVVVSPDGESYTWSTYSGGSGGSGGSTTESGFALTGALANNATTYADGTKFTKEDGSDNNYSLTVSVTDNNNNSFRIIGAKGDNYYGAYGSDPYQIDNGNLSSSENSYGTKNDGNYKGNFYFGNLGTYKIHIIDKRNDGIGVWVESVSATTYTVNYDVKGGNGSLTATGVNGSGSAVNSGTKVTFTAAPNEGYAVEGWYSDDNCQNAITNAGTKTSYEVTVHENINVYVKFKSTTIDPEYRLAGDLSAIGRWKGYSEALKFDAFETDGSYSKIITVKNEDVNSKYFKLINKDEKYYGPYLTDNKDNVDICGFNADNAYGTYENNDSAFYFSKAGTYKIHYFIDTTNNRPSVWVEENTTKHNVTVAENIKLIASVNKTKAAKDEEVTVTATPETGKVLDTVTVVDANNTQVTTNVIGNTAKFKMPDQDVTVKEVKFRDANKYTVNFSSSDPTNGKVSAQYNGAEFTSGGTVNVGDEVTITATPSGSNYIFKSWSINGDYVIKDSKTTSDAEITIVVKSNITATASFKETSPYQVAYGSNGTLMRMNKTKYDGIYLSTATIDKDTNFTIFNTAESTYGVIKEKDTYYIKDGATSTTINSWKRSYTFDSGCARNAYNKAKYVVYNANTRTITLTDDPDYGTKATLYVKNGTYSTSFKTGDTKDYAGSSVASGLNATETNPCNTYSVALNTNVNVQTTLTDTYRKAGYYVGAYCVNGRNYTASAKNADQGIYQANITITEDLAENCVVEVTPIYYNRTIEKDDNYITFYVDAERLVGDWGSTVAIYAYAYKGGTASYDNDHKVTNNVNLLGAYPGQPMVKDGQYYVAKIPRCNYVISSDDGSLKIDKTSPVAGITLNNYYNDAVHNTLVPIKRNMQTYDFSDFVALANKKDVKTIMFQSKFYNATGDANRNTSVVFGTAGEIADLNPKNPISNIGDAATIKVNPYEDFTDYYGRATDLIGNILDANQKVDENNLYVISTGSYNNQSPDYSTKGQWVTIWNVYDHSGNLITYGTPADFLNENTKQYKAIANNENYKGKPVKISYEKGLSYDNGGTSRTDGRWYYSTLGQKFTSDVAIEYKHQGQETYTADTDSNAGNNTGFVGTTTKATATINNVTTASFSSVTETAHLNVKVSNGWRFDGWFIKQGDKYTKVSDNYTDISTDVLMSNSYHIVARVSEIPTGTLELNHTAYTGTDPAAHTGTGFYYISAVVKKADNSKIEFDETQGVISIPDFAATDELTITLRAKCHGDNTVYALYKGEAGGYTEIGTGLNGKSEFTYTVTVSAGSLFENGKLAVNALNYYTDIVKVGGTCEITYKYFDRFSVEGEGKMVSYVVRNVELSTEEIRDNNYIPFDSTITKYAPRIDTMYLETKWNLKNTEKVEKGKSQATVFATQTPKKCDVYYPNKDGEYYTGTMTIKTVDYNTLFKDDNGNFILSAPEIDKNGKQFSYWDVYKADKTGDNTGELVTKCYERNFGLRIMADYYIVPVYNEKAPTLTANINAPVLNREIYGDSANPKDKLYVDLLTAFTSTAIPTFKENTTKLSVECGVFVVRNNTKTLSVDDRNNLVNAAISNLTDTTSDILLKGYIRDSAVEEGLITKLRDLAKDSNVKDKTNTVANFGNDEYRITKLVFDNNSLTNKNRIDEVLKYTNNTANQNYIFTAYAFVVIKDSHGTVQEMQISNPQYYNLCYVGNKALDNN